MTVDPGQYHAQAPSGEQNSGWRPLDCLRSLGRAASIAAGGQGREEFHGFRIVVLDHHGAHRARVTHYLGKAIRLPAILSEQFEAARFSSAEEAGQHARFLIASGALNSLLHR